LDGCRASAQVKGGEVPWGREIWVGNFAGLRVLKKMAIVVLQYGRLTRFFPLF
jgi:hypothetical protein